jgi:hypothetical protein
MTIPWQQVCDCIEKDDLATFRSWEQTDSDLKANNVFTAIAIFHPEHILQFLCVTYPDVVLEQILNGKYNYSESILCEFARDKMQYISLVLIALSSYLPQYMEQNPEKREAFKCVLDRCVIAICTRRKPDYESIEKFDTESISAIETLKQFGASPAENTNDPIWFTNTYDNTLQKLANRSTAFIRYMSANINYHTCMYRGQTLFQLLLSELYGSSICESLQYLINDHQFDPTQCHYEDGNLLHHIYRSDVLSLVLPILEEKNVLSSYLSQRNKRDMTPVDIHLKSKKIVDVLSLYDPTITEYVAKKTKPRDGTIEPGCKLYFSLKHAKERNLFGYQSSVLKFITPDDKPVLCTWKSFPDEDGSEYPFTDKQLVGVLDEKWRCYGTQCVGYADGGGGCLTGRCPVFIPLGKDSPGSCAQCWNRMRDLLG